MCGVSVGGSVWKSQVECVCVWCLFGYCSIGGWLIDKYHRLVWTRVRAWGGARRPLRSPPPPEQPLQCCRRCVERIPVSTGYVGRLLSFVQRTRLCGLSLCVVLPPGFAGTGVTVVVWADGWPPHPLCVKVVGLVVVVSHHALSDAQKTRIASVLCACGLPVLINSTLKNHLSERNEISSLYGFEHAHTHARTRTYIRIFAYI